MSIGRICLLVVLSGWSFLAATVEANWSQESQQSAEIESNKIGEASELGDDKAKPSDKVSAKEDHPTPKEIIERYVEIVGGYEAIDSIETVHKKATVTSSDNRDFEYERFYQAGGFLKTTYAYKNGLLFQRTIRDGLGWEGYEGRTTRYYSGEELKGYLFRNSVPMWCTRWFDICKKIEYVGIEEFAGKKAYVLKMFYKNGYIYDNYFDIETGMFLRTVGEEYYRGKTHEVSSTIVERKRVNGILMHTKLRVQRDSKITNFDYTEIEIDVKIDKEMFAFLPGMSKAKILEQQKDDEEKKKEMLRLMNKIVVPDALPMPAEKAKKD